MSSSFRRIFLFHLEFTLASVSLYFISNNSYKTRTYTCIHMPGANEFGQLGDGTEERRKYPKKVKQLQSEFVKSVSCGAHCTACIAEPRENDGSKLRGRLWVWGQNQVLFFLVLVHFSIMSGGLLFISSSLYHRGQIFLACFRVPSNLIR